MKILVTGANGLLGQKLVRLLNEHQEITTIATARTRDPKSTPNQALLPLDITNPMQVQSVLTQARPEIVINTAAMTQVDQCESDQEACVKVNTTAVGYLVKTCKETGSLLIQLSTDFIFDGGHGPLDETAMPGPVNFYGESKLRAETLIQESNAAWCILRTVLVYGYTGEPGRSNIVLWVKKSLESGKEIQVVNDQWRTPTLAEDLAMGCYLAATHKARGIYHIAGKDMLTPFDIAEMTAEVFGLDTTLIKPTDSTKFRQPARRPQRTGFLIDKARRTLGYEPHSFREGLEIIRHQMAP